MRITKPDDHDSSTTDDDRTSAEPMVSVDYLDDPIPVSEYAKKTDGLINEILSQPDAFGLVPEQRVEELETRLEQQQEKIEQLERFIDILATTSPAKIRGECPECGERLEEKRPLFDTDHIACSECGTAVVELK
mgnify:CR=1 FL=1|jgi:hypothetical protein